MSSADVELLIERAKRGEADAQSQLLERYRAELRRMIAIRLDRRLAARVDPSDVVQEALCSAQRRLAEYFAAPQANFYCWLRGIAWDRLIDLHRAHLAEKRSVLKEQEWLPPLNDESVAELTRFVAASSGDPCSRAMQAEMEQRVRRALEELRPLDREVLAMRFVEQLSTAEVAAIMGVKISTLTSRQLRALKRLRAALDDPSSA